MSAIEHVDVVNALLVGVMAERYAQLGPDKGGFFDFYMERLRRGEVLIHYDCGLADWIAANVPKTDIIVDVGAGFGQFSALLAANGYIVVACEYDRARFDGLVAFQRALSALKPAWGERMEITSRAYPFEIEGLRGHRSLAVFACFVATMTEATELAIIRSLKQFTATIIDIQRFGRKVRDTHAEIAELRGMLAAEGFAEPQPILQWGNGQFVLLTQEGV